MAAKARLERMERLGFGAVNVQSGMAMMGKLLSSVGTGAANQLRPQVVASVMFWGRLRSSGSFIQEIKDASGAWIEEGQIPAQAATVQTAMPTSTGPKAGALTEESITGLVASEAAGVIGVEVAFSASLIAAGLDSLGDICVAVPRRFVSLWKAQPLHSTNTGATAV